MDERHGHVTSRVERWESRTEWPLAGAAALFLGAYAWPILDARLGNSWRHACRDVDLATWAIFAMDYIIRLGLADHRWRYWYRHLPDLAVIALPLLRPLRLLRLVMLLRVLNRGATASLRGRIVVYVAGATALLIFCAALAVLDAEEHVRGANIHSFGDSLWWAATTVTTVGYGDHYPVTGEGRLVAVGLILGGIALLGVVTASFASWLIDRVRAVDESATAATRADIAELRAEVQALRATLRDQTRVN